MNYKHLGILVIVLVVGYVAGTKYPGLLAKVGI